MINDKGAGRVVTQKAASAIHTRTRDCTHRCLSGVAVRSRTMDADIIMVKITPTIVFSGPNRKLKKLTYVIMKRKFSVLETKPAFTFSGIFSLLRIDYRLSYGN